MVAEITAWPAALPTSGRAALPSPLQLSATPPLDSSAVGALSVKLKALLSTSLNCSRPPAWVAGVSPLSGRPWARPSSLRVSVVPRSVGASLTGVIDSVSVETLTCPRPSLTVQLATGTAPA